MSWDLMQMVAAPRKQREHHNIDKMKLWGTGQDIGDPIHAGVFVSQESALRLSVVWRCIRLISETLAGLPTDIVRKIGDIRQPVARPPAWVETPNPESTWFDFCERVYESLLMDGNAFILITARDALGFPAELWTLNPRRVAVRRRDSGRIFFLVDGQTEYSRFGPDNLLGDVLHIKLASAGGVRGLSPLEFARQAIGLGLVTEKFGAKFFGRGQTMSGVIQLPAATSPALAREYAELTRESWEAAHSGSENAHRPGILAGGATWQGVSITNEQAQFLDTRKFQAEDIARFYGVAPQFVGLTQAVSNWGTGVEQQGILLYRFTLKGHMSRFEQAMSLLLPRGQFLRLNHRALIEADHETEAKVLQAELQNGVISRNDWRAILDKPPVPGGDRFILPLNMQILTSAGIAEPAPAPTPAPEPVPSDNGQASLFGGGEDDKRIRELR